MDTYLLIFILILLFYRNLTMRIPARGSLIWRRRSPMVWIETLRTLRSRFRTLMTRCRSSSHRTWRSVDRKMWLLETSWQISGQPTETKASTDSLSKTGGLSPNIMCNIIPGLLVHSGGSQRFLNSWQRVFQYGMQFSKAFQWTLNFMITHQQNP